MTFKEPLTMTESQRSEGAMVMVPRDEQGRTAYDIIRDSNRKSADLRAGIKDRSREPLLGPPDDMTVSRIILAERPEITAHDADLLAVKINEALAQPAPAPQVDLGSSLRDTHRATDGEVLARHIDEWHEDMGDVLWWTNPVREAPYLGSPLCLGRAYELSIGDFSTSVDLGGWPGYHSWWTPLPSLPVFAPPAASVSPGTSAASEPKDSPAPQGEDGWSELERLARAAYHDYALADIAVGGGMRATVSVPAFISAASPSTILKLIAAARSLPDSLATMEKVDG